MVDRGYDDGKLIEKLWDVYDIKPVIDIRDMWKDGDETKAEELPWNVVCNYKGEVFCINPNEDGQQEMTYGGFEGKRGTLKYIVLRSIIDMNVEELRGVL